MTEIWDTKYGKRRVRQEPATLEDAIFAAQGMTDDLEGQIDRPLFLDLEHPSRGQPRPRAGRVEPELD